MSAQSIGIDDILEARRRIQSAVYYSPCGHSHALSKLSGSNVFLKLENLQMTGSFKERGALNKILTLTPDECARGVITASAGNHAQGVAYHAASRGIASVICMPMTTPLVKVTATRNHGAKVVLFGNDYDEAFEEALRRRDAQGFTLIHPFDDNAVIAGQGTLGLEILEQVSDLDAVVIPVGGGGLIGGIACAIKERNPRIKVFGVQTARVPSMVAALAIGGPTTLPPAASIADGIAVRRVGVQTLALVQRYVDGVVTVGEEEIANAILVLLEREKTLTEGAGAASAAALLNQKLSLEGARVALLIAGGNIDVNFLSRIIERGLVKDGRLVRLRLKLPDHPGVLHKLTGIITRFRSNVIKVEHDRTYFGVGLGDTMVDITLETRGSEHIDELLTGLESEGYPYERVV